MRRRGRINCVGKSELSTFMLLRREKFKKKFESPI